jgi:LEA14-like dessication related protein
MKHLSVAAALALAALTSSCESGPVVRLAPTVEVVSFNSTLITPDAIQFVAKVAIENEMRDTLEIQKVDWGADLHDQPLFDESFAEVKPMRSRSTTTLTLPFQIVMSDIAKQVEDVAAEESVRVTFRGTVVPVGFGPINFVAEKVLPIPRAPHLSLAGTRGNPMAGEFTVLLDVENTNHFPVAFGSVETFLRLNGKKYDLLRTESFTDLPAHGRGRIALTMRHSHGKGISMLINVAKNQSAEFSVGGKLSCETPHGTLLLPVELGSSTTAAPGR